jgi:hypothetical protein
MALCLSPSIDLWFRRRPPHNTSPFPFLFFHPPKGVCTEAGMYALRERRVHVTQEDFELAVAKIMQKDSEKNMSLKKFFT